MIFTTQSYNFPTYKFYSTLLKAPFFFTINESDGIPTMYTTNQVLESQKLFSSDLKGSPLVVENNAKS